MTTSHFRAAQTYVIPFGRFFGLSLDKIAETDEGLKYLDWMTDQSWLRDPLKTHLDHYLSDTTIKQELDAIT